MVQYNSAHKYIPLISAHKYIVWLSAHKYMLIVIHTLIIRWLPWRYGRSKRLVGEASVVRGPLPQASSLLRVLLLTTLPPQLLLPPDWLLLSLSSATCLIFPFCSALPSWLLHLWSSIWQRLPHPLLRTHLHFFCSFIGTCGWNSHVPEHLGHSLSLSLSLSSHDSKLPLLCLGQLIPWGF